MVVVVVVVTGVGGLSQLKLLEANIGARRELPAMDMTGANKEANSCNLCVSAAVHQ